MSIHPSLNSPEKDRKPRSVLKRTERLRTMFEKGQWKEGDKVYGLPKIKTVRRIKIKKEKAKELPAEATVAPAESAVTPATTENLKEQAAPKESAPKQEKK